MNIPTKRDSKPTKMDTFNKNADEIREALYETGIDVFRWHCLDFAVGLGEVIKPNKKHTVRCSWIDDNYGSYDHCGLIWNDHFCDGLGCIPTSNKKKLNDKFYQYMFGTSEEKSIQKIEVKEFKHTELEHFLEHPTVENISKTVRRFL